MANILAWSESKAPTVLAGAERTTTGGEGANKKPQTLPPSVPVGESCNDARVLVDRSHSLPPHYTPKDLVSLRSYGIPTLGNGEMRLRGRRAPSRPGVSSGHRWRGTDRGLCIPVLRGPGDSLR
jgi:hypothetical protein